MLAVIGHGSGGKGGVRVQGVGEELGWVGLGGDALTWYGEVGCCGEAVRGDG